MKYSVVFFDADGVLFDFDRAEEYALEKTFSEFGLPFENHQTIKHYRKVNKLFWQKLELGDVTPQQIRVDRFKSFLSGLDYDIDAEEFGKMYLGNLSEASFLLGDPESVLKKINGHFRLFIATNGLKEVQTKRFRKSGLLNYFEDVFISEDAGAPKPDRQFFNYAFKKVGSINRHDAIIIGDNCSSDIKGGKDYGIATCLFNPSGMAVSDECKPDYEISELSEFLEVLEIK